VGQPFGNKVKVVEAWFLWFYADAVFGGVFQKAASVAKYWNLAIF